LRSRAVRNVRALMIRPRPFHAVGRPDHRGSGEDPNQDCRVQQQLAGFRRTRRSKACWMPIPTSRNPISLASLWRQRDTVSDRGSTWCVARHGKLYIHTRKARRPASIPGPISRAICRGGPTPLSSIVDGDTLEIHGARIRLWDIDAPESTQFCSRRGQLAIPMRGTVCERSGCVHRRTASQLPADIAGPMWPYCRDVLGRGIGLCGMGWSWTGRIIQNESTMRRSMKPSTPGAGCGQEVTSSRGYIGPASEQTISRLIAPMMRASIIRLEPTFEATTET
jgi:hypothetical protein